jgi:hypothetical protein
LSNLQIIPKSHPTKKFTFLVTAKVVLGSSGGFYAPFAFSKNFQQIFSSNIKHRFYTVRHSVFIKISTN